VTFQVPTAAVTYPGEAFTYLGEAVTYLGEADTYPGEAVTYLGEAVTYPGEAVTYPGEAVTYLGKLTANPKSLSRLSMVVEPENSQRRIALCRCDRGWLKGWESLPRLCGDLALS
jgi:hypothetical protein